MLLVFYGIGNLYGLFYAKSSLYIYIYVCVCCVCVCVLSVCEYFMDNIFKRDRIHLFEHC